MSTVEKMKSLAKKLTSATSTIVDEIGKARREIAEKRRELQHATDAPVPISEIVERIQAHVREVGAVWLAEYGSSLISGDRGAGSPPWSYTGSPPWGAICASDPDYAVSFLRWIAERVPYEPGPASAERPEIIRRLELELAEIELLEENLIDDAAGAGVNVAHRPEVIQRRDAEARQRHHEERAAEARLERQKFLDDAHARRPRTGLSEYLTRNAPGAASGKQIVP